MAQMAATVISMGGSTATSLPEGQQVMQGFNDLFDSMLQDIDMMKTENELLMAQITSRENELNQLDSQQVVGDYWY